VATVSTTSQKRHLTVNQHLPKILETSDHSFGMTAPTSPRTSDAVIDRPFVTNAASAARFTISDAAAAAAM
jgi:hypothetical protein